MHELGITQSIIEIAQAHARAENAAQVLSVTVEIGALSGVVPDAVEFCFEACSKETLLDGARLIIEFIPGRARCSACAWEDQIDQLTYACPGCGNLSLERLQGEELRVKELEID
ncbi:MAG: hydrogenase maturation nickel metallochaperone HypA [Desulfuromonadaceae bacterium]|nr:hydrogenase maturation nickel metallochaperone HypA [Desulfuromonadaceae bacterium]